MRLVFDTNTLISALLFEGSKPSQAFNTGVKDGVILISSTTLTELENVLWRKKFDKYITNEERMQFLSSFILHTTHVEVGANQRGSHIMERSVCND